MLSLAHSERHKTAAHDADRAVLPMRQHRSYSRSMPSKRRGSITAEELMNQLNSDPEYLARVAKADAERRERRERLRQAEQPLVDDLRTAGIDVKSAWYLYEVPNRGEDAYPILLNHLRRDYPDRILNGIARAFTKDVARRHWRELLDLYLHEDREEARDGLAATLSGCAARAQYEDLLAILKNDSLGSTRIYFLRPVNRIGNRISPGAGRAVIAGLADDPVLGIESKRILQGRGRND